MVLYYIKTYLILKSDSSDSNFCKLFFFYEKRSLATTSFPTMLLCIPLATPKVVMKVDTSDLDIVIFYLLQKYCFFP